jgi:hypothetical protein
MAVALSVVAYPHGGELANIAVSVGSSPFTSGSRFFDCQVEGNMTNVKQERLLSGWVRRMAMVRVWIVMRLTDIRSRP